MKITMSEDTRTKIVGGISLAVFVGAIWALSVDWGAEKKALSGVKKKRKK